MYPNPKYKPHKGAGNSIDEKKAKIFDAVRTKNWRGSTAYIISFFGLYRSTKTALLFFFEHHTLIIKGDISRM